MIHLMHVHEFMFSSRALFKTRWEANLPCVSERCHRRQFRCFVRHEHTCRVIAGSFSTDTDLQCLPCRVHSHGCQRTLHPQKKSANDSSSGSISTFRLSNDWYFLRAGSIPQRFRLSLFARAPPPMHSCIRPCAALSQRRLCPNFCNTVPALRKERSSRKRFRRRAVINSSSAFNIAVHMHRRSTRTGRDRTLFSSFFAFGLGQRCKTRIQRARGRCFLCL